MRQLLKHFGHIIEIYNSFPLRKELISNQPFITIENLIELQRKPHMTEVHLVIDPDVRNLFMTHTVYGSQLPQAVVEVITEMAASEMTECANCGEEIWTYLHPTEERYMFPQYDDDFWICVECVQLPQKWSL